MKDTLILLDRSWYMRTRRAEKAGPNPDEQAFYTHFRGLCGLAWRSIPIDDQPLGRQPLDKAAALRSLGDDSCNLVYVANPSVSSLPGFAWRGFDIGWISSAWSIFSVIENEIYPARIRKLHFFKDKLNSHLLFEDERHCHEILKLRHALVQDGTDLEHGLELECEVLSIFEPIGN